MKWIQGLRLLNGDVQVKMLEDSNLLMYLTPDESLRVRSHSLTPCSWRSGSKHREPISFIRLTNGQWSHGSQRMAS